MLVACHPNRWWDWCMSKDGKKETDTMFIEELQMFASVVYNMGILKYIAEECFSSMKLGSIDKF